MHHDSKVFEVDELVAAKGGSKLAKRFSRNAGTSFVASRFHGVRGSREGPDDGHPPRSPGRSETIRFWNTESRPCYLRTWPPFPNTRKIRRSGLVPRSRKKHRSRAFVAVIWTPGTRLAAPFDWSLTTTRHISRKKPGLSWLRARIASSMR